jgi:hypothetical protein
MAMNELNLSWAWLSLVLLGAFHGLNPAMGWLFAVSLGFQERRLSAVVKALGPITLGHALAIGLVAVPVGLLGVVVPREAMLTLIGLVLLGFAGYKVATRFRHTRWVGMRVRPWELILWSFLMATAHGAGLMLAPVLAGMRGEAVPSALAHAGHADHLAQVGHAGHQATASSDGVVPAIAAVALHSTAMLAVAAVLAVMVYRRLGVAVLRRAWINLDFVWVGAFVVAGAITLGLGLLPSLLG